VDGIWAFLALTVLLSVTPGPDEVLVVRSSLAGGPRLGMVTVAGVASGSLVWGLAAAAGLATVVARSPSLYGGLRLLGAGCLLLAGTASLVADVGRRRRRVVGGVPSGSGARPPGGAGSAFAVGLLSDLLNPKIGLFYLAVLPRFVPAGAPALRFALLLCAVDVAVAATWLAALAWLTHLAVDWLLRPPVVSWSQRITSTVLIGLGICTALGL
jgi:threonine/homoserine/homoserine lactone efflux protein